MTLQQKLNERQEMVKRWVRGEMFYFPPVKIKRKRTSKLELWAECEMLEKDKKLD